LAPRGHKRPEKRENFLDYRVVPKRLNRLKNWKRYAAILYRFADGSIILPQDSQGDPPRYQTRQHNDKSQKLSGSH
jgi:hypothetical protein